MFELNDNCESSQHVVGR